MPSERRSDDDVVIVAGARTPFTKFGGALAGWSLPDLGAAATIAALQRAGLPASDVEELAFGVNLPGSDRSIARQISLHAGVPDSSNSFTIDRACCSSLAAISAVARSLRLGDVDIAIAGGAENMSRTPYFLETMRWGQRLGDVVLKDQLVISCPFTGVPRAQQASNEAQQFGIDRSEQDEFAVRSQQRYADSAARGEPAEEIVTLGEIVADQGNRPGTTLAQLAALPTVNGSDTVTAGNAPGLSTGSVALVLTTRREAARRSLAVLATLESTAMASGPPANIASIPAVSARRALERAERSLDDMALIEINEAFAAVPLVATQVLGDGDRAQVQRLRERVNVNGGAIAIGHPTGATAARLVLSAAHALRRRGGGHALITICGGIGEAEAAVIRVDGDDRSGVNGTDSSNEET